MMNGMDPKKKVLEELMSYLDEKDGAELGEAMKPKGVEVAVEEVSEVPAPEGEASPQMSEEELAELIEAIQSKIS